MKKMIKYIILNLYYYFWRWMIVPVKRWINLFIKGQYIEDNDRNRQIMQFCEKILRDRNYEASNPVEHWMEKQLREFYEYNVKEAHAVNPNIKDIDDMNQDYLSFRARIAWEMAMEMSEHVVGRAA